MRKEAAYLLRLWNDGKSDRTWRASLQNVHSKEVMGFASLEILFDYLAEHKLMVQELGTTDQDLVAAALDER